MNPLDLVKLILSRSENERRYMESVARRLPEFKKADSATIPDDHLGDPAVIAPGTAVDTAKKLLAMGLDWSRDIAHCHEYLQKRWPRLRRAFQDQTGKDIFLTCTWRSPENQAKLYAQGRTAPGKIVTNIDGTNRLSQHNYFPSRAIDVCVDDDPSESKVVVNWKEAEYLPLGPICEELGLIWGGSWTSIKDLPHIQLPRNIA